jgi:hypothetical protein
MTTTFVDWRLSIGVAFLSKETDFVINADKDYRQAKF